MGTISSRYRSHAGEWLVDALLGACFGFVLFGPRGALIMAVLGPLIGQAPRARRRRNLERLRELQARSAVRRVAAGRAAQSTAPSGPEPGSPPPAP